MSSSPRLRTSRSWSSLNQRLVADLEQGNRTARRRLLGAVRRLRLRFGDPPVEVSIGDQRILMPLSHMLPVYRALHPQYSENLAAIVAVVEQLRPGLVVVDIGANVGDSIALIRTRSAVPVLAIEGDEHYLPYLRANSFSLEDIEIEDAYVGAVGIDFATLSVRRFEGTAQLVGGAANHPLTSFPLKEILARHPLFIRPGLIKIDTDGYDTVIIADNLDLLSEVRPVLFFEFDPKLTKSVEGGHPRLALEALGEIGYETFFLYDNRGPLLHTIMLRDLGQLDELVRGLGHEEAPDYFDVCAVHGTSLDLVEPIRGASLRLHGGSRG
jgi:FkbM family methyltransferase